MLLAYSITLSITSLCTFLSLTTPFFPTFSLPASNCGFIKHTILPLSVRRFFTGKSTFVREINDTSIDANSILSSIASGVT